jgi:hypothetical protein
MITRHGLSLVFGICLASFPNRPDKALLRAKTVGCYIFSRRFQAN